MTKLQKGMEKFYAAHTDAFKKYSLPLAKYFSEDQLSGNDKEKMMAILTGALMPTSEYSDNLSKENRILAWLVERFGEINDSMEYLRDSLVYIQRFPYEKTRVTKVRCFRYVVENFLREIYSLDQRLKKFAERIAEEYEQLQRKQFDQSVVYKAYFKARISLKQQIDARNILVHESRDFDTQLYRLTQLEQRVNVTFVNTDFLDSFRSLLQSEFTRAIEERSREMKSVVRDIEEIVDEFFVSVNSVILDENDKIWFPE